MLRCAHGFSALRLRVPILKQAMKTQTFSMICDGPVAFEQNICTCLNRTNGQFRSNQTFLSRPSRCFVPESTLDGVALH